MLPRGKIINDPVHGFITIPGGLIQDIVDHGYFQRLRRILQLGLTNMVYPGANHTRFHHALGAMHLMGVALETLRDKGIVISDQESEAARLAILLHDIGPWTLFACVGNQHFAGCSTRTVVACIYEQAQF
jgi:HD superfamily phosphohydrolase